MTTLVPMSGTGASSCPASYASTASVSARTGVGVVEQQGGEPTDLRALAPPLERERVVGFDDGTQLRARDLGREETPRGVTQELLLRGQVPDHGPSAPPIGALLWW